MTLSPGQFHEHLSEMEMGGVSFPGPGVAQVGSRAFPATKVTHEHFNSTTPGEGHGWGTDVYMPDERAAGEHLLMVNRSNGGPGLSSMAFHPSTSIGKSGPDSGSMFWSAEPPEGPDTRSRRGLVVNSQDEFMERLPDMIRNAPPVTQDQRRPPSLPPRSPQPFHQVHVHTPTIDGGTMQAHEYDPRSRSLTRDPENDYR